MMTFIGNDSDVSESDVSEPGSVERSPLPSMDISLPATSTESSNLYQLLEVVEDELVLEVVVVKALVSPPVIYLLVPKLYFMRLAQSGRRKNQLPILHLIPEHQVLHLMSLLRVPWGFILSFFFPIKCEI